MSQEEAERLAEEARQAMSPYDAFDVVSNLLFSNLPLDVDVYKETEHRGLMSIVEYGARLCAERPSRAGSGSREAFIQGPVIDLWNDALRGVLFSGMWGQMSGAHAGESPELADLRAAVTTRELLVRHPSFEHQEKATLRALFGSPRIDEQVRDATGFSLEEALAMEDVFDSIPGAALSAMALDGRQALSSAREEIDERRRTQSVDPANDDTFDWLASMPRKQAETRLRNMVVAWSWLYAGDRLQVTAEELADKSGCDLDATNAFLGFFSMEFGQLPSDVAGGIREVREKPILADGEGRFLCISVGDLLYGLRPRLTDALHEHANDKGDSRIWERFNSVRRKYLESSTEVLLKQALRPDVSHTNVGFRLDGKDYEMDGLVLLDQVAIVVETKAGTLSAASRRGAPDSLRDELKHLVKEAAVQLGRAQRVLIESDVLEITVGKQKVEIDTSHIRRVFLLAVTLEDLSFVAPTVWDMIHSAILPEGSAPPLLMNLHDIEIICDVVDLPSLLVHYFVRRGRLNRQELVRASDELDLFVHFLNHGLFFEEESDDLKGVDVLFLPSLTDDLDAYYLWQQGLRKKPARKPGQKMHKELRRVLDQLDQTRPSGFVEASQILLDFGDQGRKAFGQGLAQQRRRSAGDGTFHDLTIGHDGPPKVGVSVMTAPPAAHRDELLDRLRTYCAAKKYQLGADVWLGFGSIAQAKRSFHAYVLDQSPWREDDTLATLVKELGLRQSTPGTLKEAKQVAQELSRQTRRPGSEV
jgi:hypothetical protein